MMEIMIMLQQHKLLEILDNGESRIDPTCLVQLRDFESIINLLINITCIFLKIIF